MLISRVSIRRVAGTLLSVLVSIALCASLASPSMAAGKGAAVLEKTDYDLVIVGGTPGGVAMSVRAAREGLNVLLVNHTPHLGGLLSNGLSVWDTLHEGKRSPVYDELRQAIFDYYRNTYGPESPQYRNALPGKSGHTNGKFEAKVAEKLIDEMVGRESRIRVLKGFYPSAVEVEGALIRSVTLRRMGGDETVRVAAPVFADCTYEGDLFAAAKVPYRVGREARSEFNEPHAGVIYMAGKRAEPGSLEETLAAAHDRLNLRKFRGVQIPVMPNSTGEGDRAVQAYNYRTVLSSDPANRILPEKPKDYDPAQLRKLEHGSKVGPLPNNKLGWNRPQLIGPQSDYPDSDWARRHEVMQAHWDATLALLYFLQHDPSVDEATRKSWEPWGLAKDEFTDNGNRPHEIYVREARRLVGRYVFAEHDASLPPGLNRAPSHGDSVGVTEWYMDSHACTPPHIRGALQEGKMMLDISTFPGQVPYRCLLSEKLDNLLVPVCLSSTHVSWGTIRLEPTWMNIAESAAYAAAMAVKQKRAPAAIETDELLRTLADRRVMIAFFNDVDLGSDASWVPAVQYLGTKGFFTTYDARPDESLSASVAQQWTKLIPELRAGRIESSTAAVRELNKPETTADEPITVARFAGMLRGAAADDKQWGQKVQDAITQLKLQNDAPIRRAAACEVVYRALR